MGGGIIPAATRSTWRVAPGRLTAVYIYARMGTVLHAGCSGEGSVEIDEVFHALDAVVAIQAEVVTMPPKGRLMGIFAPQGAQHVGAIGVGWSELDSSGETSGLMSWWFYVQWTRQYIVTPNWQAGAQFYGTLFWRLVPGAVVDITTVV